MESTPILEWFIIGILTIILLLVLLRNKKASEEQIELEAEKLLEKWKKKEEKRIRQNAIDGSQAVTLGKSIEHIIPYFKDFPYDPKDVRFLGSPIDLIVFDGLNAGELEQVIFIEVKTGKTPRLPEREKMVKECVENGRVHWQLLHYQT